MIDGSAFISGPSCASISSASATSRPSDLPFFFVPIGAIGSPARLTNKPQAVGSRSTQALVELKAVYLWSAVCIRGVDGREDNKSGAGVMSVPLDFQRKCEQRWRARIAQPAPSAASQSHQPEGQNQQLAAPAKANQKTDLVKRRARRSAPAA
jgi:hypothetical protein